MKYYDPYKETNLEIQQLIFDILKVAITLAVFMVALIGLMCL